MTEKRYFEKKWEEEFYIFDSNTISESDFEEKLEYQGYKAFEDSMTGDTVVNRLNELTEENENITLFAQHNYEESKRIINRYVDKIKELERGNKELKVENEQLKKENNELKLMIQQDEFAKEEGFK